jgi:hypothetical protein
VGTNRMTKLTAVRNPCWVVMSSVASVLPGMRFLSYVAARKFNSEAAEATAPTPAKISTHSRFRGEVAHSELHRTSSTDIPKTISIVHSPAAAGGNTMALCRTPHTVMLGGTLDARQWGWLEAHASNGISNGNFTGGQDMHNCQALSCDAEERFFSVCDTGRCTLEAESSPSEGN